MAILSTLESISLEETTRCALKWFILALKKKQNLELVLVKCVTYTQPIPLSLTYPQHQKLVTGFMQDSMLPGATGC